MIKSPCIKLYEIKNYNMMAINYGKNLTSKISHDELLPKKTVYLVYICICGSNKITYFIALSRKICDYLIFFSISIPTETTKMASYQHSIRHETAHLSFCVILFVLIRPIIQRRLGFEPFLRAEHVEVLHDFHWSILDVDVLQVGFVT